MSNSSGAGATTASPARASAAKKQRILWDSDSATRGGKTSIAVLLEWLTAPGNYARWRSGKAALGETRETLCSEIKAALRRQGILHRENANIRTQISELERSYEAARVWLAKHGHSADAVSSSKQHDGDGDGSSRSVVEATVLRLCRYFHVLDPIMRQADGDPAALRTRRPYAPRKRRDRDGDDQLKAANDDGSTDSASVKSTGSASNGTTAASTTAPQGERVAPIVAPTLPVTTAVPEPPLSVPMPMTMPGATAPFGLLAPWANPALLSGLEDSKRQFMESVRDERERKRREFEWEQERSQLEREKLRLQVEDARLKLEVERALARRKLLDARVPEAEIERILAGSSGASQPK